MCLLQPSDYRSDALCDFTGYVNGGRFDQICPFRPDGSLGRESGHFLQSEARAAHKKQRRYKTTS